jgi:hypothetical protein
LADADNEKKNDCAKEIVTGLERNFKDAFLHFVVEKGYSSTNRAGTMSATFLNGMCEAANLKVTQQHEINKYLMYHYLETVYVFQKRIYHVSLHLLSGMKDSQR